MEYSFFFQKAFFGEPMDAFRCCRSDRYEDGIWHRFGRLTEVLSHLPAQHWVSFGMFPSPEILAFVKDGKLKKRRRLKQVARAKSSSLERSPNQ
ncbi:hypothetical protein [Paraburkholderia caledonica]